MKRLTYREELDLYRDIDCARYKLCLLEDIEEELGIDFITLFKALKQGYIFRKIYLSEKDLGTENFEIIKQDIDLLNFEEGHKSNAVLHCACLGKTEEQGNYKQCYQYLNYINDYGKTWALTREELEDDE